jgi:hypothetical protein
VGAESFAEHAEDALKCHSRGVAVATIDLLSDCEELSGRDFQWPCSYLGTIVFLHGYLYVGILAVVVVTVAS